MVRRLTLLMNGPTDGRLESTLSFESFQGQLLSIFNVSEPVTYLFQRFDTYGDGVVRSVDFARSLVGFTPRGDASPSLRVACREVRAALSSTMGIHGLRRLAQELLRGGEGALSVRAAKALLSRVLGGRAGGEVGVVVGEASRPHAYTHVTPREVVDMLRPALTRTSRLALQATWVGCGGRLGMGGGVEAGGAGEGGGGGGGGGSGGSSLPLSALARPTTTSLHLLAGEVAKDFTELWGTPLTASPSVVTFKEWLEYGRDVLGCAGGEEGLVRLLKVAFGLDGGWGGVGDGAAGASTLTFAPLASPTPLPGSPVAALRALRTSAFFPSATARVAPLALAGEPGMTGRFAPPPAFPPRVSQRSGAASEASGVPAILNQPLGRALPSRGWETFKYGVLQPFTSEVKPVPFGDGDARAKPHGATFLPPHYPPTGTATLPKGMPSVAGLWKGANSNPMMMGGYTQTRPTRI